jgi:hypothetical protein
MTLPPKAAAGAKPDDPDVLARREVTRMLKGPVCETFVSLLPPLAGRNDPYAAIMETPELLDGCFRLFRLRRDAFAEFLVDAGGAPVADDTTRLRCGRSVAEVIGMSVRTGMRHHAEAFFGDPIDPARSKGKDGKKQPPYQSPMLKQINVARIAEAFLRNHGADRALRPGQSQSGRFYGALKDALEYDWQVRLFPVYVLIPAHLIERLGHGITRMDSEDKLLALAEMPTADIIKAERVLKKAELIRDMFTHNILAASAVAELGEAGFATLQDALAALPKHKTWDILANKNTAKKLHEDKRLTGGDITALAPYLDVLNEDALDMMLELHLDREQMTLFLGTAEQHLGQELFRALFGPNVTHLPDDADEQAKLRKYLAFTQTSLRNLVGAVKQLEEQARRADAGSIIGECLESVCKARRDQLEQERRKLALKH